ncbi:hypothetical protein [Streptomyces sp. NPDC001978]|uniref:hypothetical protein n=1 Tax=Streptomyces sp. NPDC001978 TaxID=3364627 RepID=UPI0036B27A60
MTENITRFTRTDADGNITVHTVDHDRHGNAETMAQVANESDRFTAEFRSQADFSASLPEDIRTVLSGASSKITATLAKVDAAVAQRAKYLADDTLFPQGRERLASEATGKAAKEVAEALAQADVAITIAEADLFVAARPKLSHEAGMAARADAQMVLNGVDNHQLANRIKELAAQDGPIGALMASDWLDLYITSRGMEKDLADAIKTRVAHAVFTAAAQSGDRKRAAAGRTALALGTLRKSAIAARVYSRNKLSK